MEKLKVIFVQNAEDGNLEFESLWCGKVDDGCIVDNIPFIAKRISLGDKIKVEYDEEEKAYYFDNFIEVSGNSTVRIFFKTPDMIEVVGKELEKLGCIWEGFTQKGIMAVSIPKAINYSPVKNYLDKGEENGEWTYEESCLCHQD